MAPRAPAAVNATTSPALVAAELAEVDAGCVLCDLSSEGLTEAVGPDAEAFLHGQFSSDVGGLARDRAQLSTYSTPKGRVLATLLLWRTREGFLLQTPGSSAASLRKRLSMFVLRSKLRLLPAEERFARFGLCGLAAARTLETAGLPAPGSDFDVKHLEPASDANEEPAWVLRLPGNRYEIVAPLACAARAWEHVERAGARPGSGAAWRSATVRSGIAEITAATQDQWVPQMLNYELLGGVSFTKGCYPGQEIVARTQYRGELKRRTVLLHAPQDEVPLPGQPVFAQGSDAPVGAVLSCAPARGGGFDLLACLHLELARDADLRLGTVAGTGLRRLDLPYALPGSR